MARKARIEVFNSVGTRTAMVEQDYQDLTFERNLHNPGGFTITMKINSSKSAFFVLDGFIRIDGDNYKCGIITELVKTVDKDGIGGQSLTVRGRELWSIFDRRVLTLGTGTAVYELKDKAETVLKTLVRSQAGSTASAKRVITGLTVATDSARGGDYIVSSYGTNLLDELSKCAQSSGIGVYAYLVGTELATITMDTIHGVDRRTSQSTNAHALFSTQVGTVQSSKLTSTYNNYKNLIYVAGTGEGVNRTVRTAYTTTEPESLARREAYKDQRNLTTNAKLDQAGVDLLAANSTTLYIDSKALEFSKLKYQTNFDLGDLVTIKDFGVTQDARVVSVTENWIAGKYSIDIVFDKEKARLDRQIATQLQSVNNTIAGTSANVQTDAATPLTVVTRDSAGRAKTADPSAATDIANKQYVDTYLPLLKNTATFQNNGSDASNDIDFLTIKAIDTTGVFLFNSSTTVTKRLDASWTAGTNQGGLDTGSEATSTWYACWAIAKADGTIDYLFSLSATAPTMPTGYVYKVRIGWIYNQSTSIIRPFFQKDRLFSWSTQVQDRAIAGYGVATRITITVAAAPLTKAVIICRFLGVAGASYGWIGDVSATDTTTSATYFDFFASNAYSQSAEMEIYVSGTSTIASRTNDGGSTLGVSTKGFIDII